MIIIGGIINLIQAQEKPTKTDQPEVKSLTIKECLDLANKNNTQVKNALIDYQNQKQINKEVTAAAYPDINGAMNLINFTDIPTNILPGAFLGRPGTFIPIQFGQNFSSTANITLSQIIFDGQIFIALKANKGVLDAAFKKYEITQIQIKANVLKICYQLVAAKIQAKVIIDNINRLKRNLDDLIFTASQGLAEQIDVDKLKVQLENLNFEKRKLDIATQNGYYGLKTLIGLKSKNDIELTDTISINDLTQNFLTDISDFKYQDRKDFQALELSKTLTSLNIKRYQYSKLPTVKFGAYYGFNAFDNDLNILLSQGPWFKNSNISLGLNIPIFGGLARNARIQQTKLSLAQINNNIEQTKIQIDNDIKTFQNSLIQAIENIDLQKKNWNLATQVYQQISERFRQGVASATDLYNSQIELNIAQNNYFTALYTAIIAKIDLQNSLGKL